MCSERLALKNWPGKKNRQEELCGHPVFACQTNLCQFLDEKEAHFAGYLIAWPPSSLSKSHVCWPAKSRLQIYYFWTCSWKWSWANYLPSYGRYTYKDPTVHAYTEKKLLEEDPKEIKTALWWGKYWEAVLTEIGGWTTAGKCQLEFHRFHYAAGLWNDRFQRLTSESSVSKSLQRNFTRDYLLSIKEHMNYDCQVTTGKNFFLF